MSGPGPARSGLAAAAILAAIAVLVSGCSPAGDRFSSPVALKSAPEPAVSPPPAEAPAGHLVAVGPEPEGVVTDLAANTVAVAVRGSTPGVDLLDAETGDLQKFVPLDGAARHLGLVGTDGPLLVPNETDDRLDLVRLPDGQVLASVPVGRQPHDAAGSGGAILVGDELADTAHLVSGGQVTAVVPAPLQPGGVAAVGVDFVVVGVRARTVAALGPDGALLSRAVAGAGPTHVVAGRDGYFYVADTLGGAVIVYRLQGKRIRTVARVGLGPGSRPYGLAVDPSADWLFVTLTGTNQLVGLRLDGGRVRQRLAWPTGRQPNSVTVDRAAGAAVVTVTAAGQAEFIPLPRGA